MLHSMGATDVEIVYNAEDAVEACKRKKYDVILSDYNLILLSELGSTRDVNKEVSHLLSKLSFAYEFVYFQDKCFANLFIKFAPNTLKIVPFKFD